MKTTLASFCGPTGMLAWLRRILSEVFGTITSSVLLFAVVWMRECAFIGDLHSRSTPVIQ
jgi:hypothetical protein